MSMQSWSMTRRLILSMIGIIGGLWLCGAIYVSFAVHHEIDEVFDSALQETAQRLLPIAVHDIRDRRKHPDSHRLDDFVSGPHKEYIHYQVRDGAGRVLMRSHDAPDEPYPIPLTAGFLRMADRLYFTELTPEGDVAVQVAEVPNARIEALEAVRLGLLLPLLAGLPLAVVAIRETVRRLTRPVGEFRNELHARDGSNLAPLEAIGFPEELMPIVEDVNRLLGRLNSALEAERTFAATSAHELRNPIAAAQAQARVLFEDLEDAVQKRRAQDLATSLGKLSRKLETLMQLARAEAGVAFAREEMRFDELCALLAGEYARKPAAQNRLIFEKHAEGPIIISGDQDALGIAIQNLIDNALKHSPPGSSITVRVGPGAKLEVTNDGPIIEPEELATLKQRFQRGTNGAENGSGLGLYIADTIARQSGGVLNIFSPARGATSGFEVELDLTTSPTGRPRG